jgi:hypothetical protein
MNKTVKEMKKWAKDNKSLAETVALATAFAQCETERVAAYTKPIFDTYEFYADLKGEDGERLTDPDKLYLSEDDEKCAAYYAELDKAHREHGFDGPEGHCPALVAQDLQRQAEQALLNALGEFSGVDGMDFNQSLELRAKALDMAMSCCLGKLV